MSSESLTQMKLKKLSILWDREAGFSLAPRVVPVSSKRLLKRCTISISTRKPSVRLATHAVLAGA